tara:strand:- start:734 stop:994 length:261 start_codon:yes stop_codon:yes gene_type:complete
MTEHTHTHDIDGYLSHAENISLSIVGGNEVLIAILGIAILMAICFLANRRCTCRKNDNTIGFNVNGSTEYKYNALGERSKRFTNYN